MTTISFKNRVTNNPDDVKRWQQVIGFTGTDVDGDFGPHTDTVTRAWQKQHKLVPDGVVGGATWGAAGVQTDAPIEISPQAKSNDQWAYQVAKNAAPDMPEKRRQYVLTVARGEGHYGKGWKAGEGAGSNNWGAVQGTGSAGAFLHGDNGWMIPDANGQPTSKHWNGSGPKVWGPYNTKFKAYNTPEEGFLDMAHIILNGGKRGEQGAVEITKAIDKSNLHDAVYAQHSNGYFELAPEKYLSAVKTNYQALSQSTGWDMLLIKQGMTLISIVLGLTTSVIVGLFAWGKMKR